VVTAYALAFGSLLLLGGRLGDMFSRKRVFITGLIGFAGASALGGAATSFGMLVTARTLQGVFGAILAPAALGTLVSTFRDPRERGRAFGVFGSVAGGGVLLAIVLLPSKRRLGELRAAASAPPPAGVLAGAAEPVSAPSLAGPGD
jgi:MFS family permease